MVILDQTKLRPNMPAYTFLRKCAGQCGKECITISHEGKKAGSHNNKGEFQIRVSDDICLACLNRVKKCPDDAVKVVKVFRSPWDFSIRPVQLVSSHDSGWELN